MKKWFLVMVLAMMCVTPVSAESSDKIKSAPYVPSGCDLSKTTICTMEVWLAHKHKKNKKALRQMLKDRTIKVLRHTFQFWKPRGGHPPTNIAIGHGLSAVDARWVIEFALKHNDRIDGLIYERLNPAYYVAVATSAWDDKSETKITPEQLEQLRDPNLSTHEFHALYVKLTGERAVAPKFY